MSNRKTRNRTHRKYHHRLTRKLLRNDRTMLRKIVEPRKDYGEIISILNVFADESEKRSGYWARGEEDENEMT